MTPGRCWWSLLLANSGGCSCAHSPRVVIDAQHDVARRRSVCRGRPAPPPLPPPTSPFVSRDLLRGFKSDGLGDLSANSWSGAVCKEVSLESSHRSWRRRRRVPHSTRPAYGRFDRRAGAARPTWRYGGGHQEARRVHLWCPRWTWCWVRMLCSTSWLRIGQGCPHTCQTMSRICDRRTLAKVV